jgi:hypothetical protein
MSEAQIESFFALALGFAVAGSVASLYQLVTRRPPSFRLLRRGPRPSTFAAIPMLAFAAPFIIMRNTIRGSRFAHPGFVAVMIATVVAGCWSLMSGTAVLMAFTAILSAG